jgi:hypothetical protein
MRSDPQEVRERFTATAREIQTLAFIPRDTELQQAAVERARQLFALIKEQKARAIQEADELWANELLLMELAATAVTEQLHMCLALKREAPEAAWDHLVNAQSACEAAIKVRRQVDSGPEPSALENLLEYLLHVEATVFPPQVFMSIGGTVDERECSICGQNYDACGHIKGRAYMGRVCSTILRDVTVEEASLVDIPANKHARVTHFSDGGGRRNKMTWRLEADSNVPAAERGVAASMRRFLSSSRRTGNG